MSGALTLETIACRILELPTIGHVGAHVAGITDAIEEFRGAMTGYLDELQALKHIKPLALLDNSSTLITSPKAKDSVEDILNAGVQEFERVTPGRARRASLLMGSARCGTCDSGGHHHCSSGVSDVIVAGLVTS